MTTGRILITGATGFVGRHVVSQLLLERRRLTLAVRKIGASTEHWRDHDIKIIETGPIETSRNLGNAFSNVSAVVHLAGLAHVAAADDLRGEDPFMRVNARGTERLAEAAAGGGIKTFIHLSSLAAITENASTARVDDETDNQPATPYGKSKRVAEQYVLTLPAKGIASISLRPPLIIGADATGNWGALQRLAATGLPLPFASVRNRRSMIAVASIAKAISHLCSHDCPVEKSGNYCIADPGTTSLAEIVAELRKGMGMTPRLVPFPPSMLYGTARLINQQRRVAGMLGDLEVDPTRFRRTFEFQETQDLRQSIRDSGRLFRQDRRALAGATRNNHRDDRDSR